MSCSNVKECVCPKTDCPRHAKCCECVINHRGGEKLPACLRPEFQKK
jgi:hypothetical protein